MVCKGKWAEEANWLEASTGMARASVDGAPRCIKPECNRPLMKDGRCVLGHPQTATARASSQIPAVELLDALNCVMADLVSRGLDDGVDPRLVYAEAVLHQARGEQLEDSWLAHVWDADMLVGQRIIWHQAHDAALHQAGVFADRSHGQHHTLMPLSTYLEQQRGLSAYHGRPGGEVEGAIQGLLDVVAGKTGVAAELANDPRVRVARSLFAPAGAPAGTATGDVKEGADQLHRLLALALNEEWTDLLAPNGVADDRFIYARYALNEVRPRRRGDQVLVGMVCEQASRGTVGILLPHLPAWYNREVVWGESEALLQEEMGKVHCEWTLTPLRQYVTEHCAEIGPITGGAQAMVVAGLQALLGLIDQADDADLADDDRVRAGRDFVERAQQLREEALVAAALARSGPGQGQDDESSVGADVTQLLSFVAPRLDKPAQRMRRKLMPDDTWHATMVLRAAAVLAHDEGTRLITSDQIERAWKDYWLDMGDEDPHEWEAD